jgi:hypothetical protein
MESKSETFTDKGATVEVGTIIHEGREFSNLSSVIDEARGIISCYPKGATATNWNGQVINGLRLTVTSSWRTPRSFMSDRMFAYSATYKGTRYHGRGAGDGMLLNLRRSK